MCTLIKTERSRNNPKLSEKWCRKIFVLRRGKQVVYKRGIYIECNSSRSTKRNVKSFFFSLSLLSPSATWRPVVVGDSAVTDEAPDWSRSFKLRRKTPLPLSLSLYLSPWVSLSFRSSSTSSSSSSSSLYVRASYVSKRKERIEQVWWATGHIWRAKYCYYLLLK